MMPPMTIYHGGHLDLVTEAGHLAPLVEAFLGAETQSASCLRELMPSLANTSAGLGRAVP
jgi:hypothetical protein